ncbi:MAG: DUF1302 family protein [Desulfobacterales bacterium]|jgi:hypothetical protein|nr:DUF1302 family protein [Desulfobacterales bacterium]
MVKKKKSVLAQVWRRGIKFVMVGMCSLVLTGMLPTLSKAFEVEMSEDSKLNIKTTLNYGISYRATEPDSFNLRNINGDDGNRNFDEGTLTSNRASISTEVAYTLKNFLFYTAVYGFYDQAYTQDNDNDSPLTNNNFVGGRTSKHDEFDDDTREIHGRGVNLRDLYVSGDFRFADRNLMVRVGKQVVTWGEALATFGSIGNAMSYADATQVNVPGFELKDVYLPSGQAMMQMDVIEDFSVAAYYQWEYKKNVLDAAGSFFSTSDLLDKGGHYFLRGPGQVLYTRVHDDEPDDSGQWGVNLRYLARALNYTEMNLCYINYHEKFPMFRANPSDGTYRLAYAEDVKLIGASFGTLIGETNIGGEIAYRQDLPLSVVGGKFKEFDVVQYLLNVYQSYGPFLFIDQTLVLLEGGYNSVMDAENLAATIDTDACGYLLKFTFKFNNIFPGYDMEVPVTWKHKVNGMSALTGTWTEDQNEIAVGFDFTFDLDLKFGVSYTEFLGDAEDYAKADRDYVAAYVKYTF